MMMGNLNEEASNHDAISDEFVESEDGELYFFWKSETGREYSPNLGTIRAKATLKVEGREKPTQNVFFVDALATPEPNAGPRPTLMEYLRNPQPGKRCWKL